MASEEVNIIKGILNARCREGATVENIKGNCDYFLAQDFFHRNICLNSENLPDDFTEFIGKPWQMADRTWNEIEDYMASIDGVYCMGARGDSMKWYIRSEESAHIQKLILKQKRQIERSPSPKKCVAKKFASNSIEPKECFFKDNYAYKYKR